MNAESVASFVSASGRGVVLDLEAQMHGHNLSALLERLQDADDERRRCGRDVPGSRAARAEAAGTWRATARG